MQQFLNTIITRQGCVRSVILLLLTLLCFVVLLTCFISLLLYGGIKPACLLLTAGVTLLTAPYILYAFVNMILRLHTSEEKMRRLSIMDDLTGVHNRRFFLQQAEQELAKAKRYGTVFSIILLDIDNFKSINDAFGHFGGDAVLRALAEVCRKNLRAVDVFARYGGEEFVFLIPESDKSDISVFAGRIRMAVAGMTVVYQEARIKLTASLGVKRFDEEIQSLEALLKAADAALYAAKRRGKNCVVLS